MQFIPDSSVIMRLLKDTKVQCDKLIMQLLKDTKVQYDDAVTKGY